MFSAFPKSGEDRENPPPHRARGCAPVQSAFPENAAEECGAYRPGGKPPIGGCFASTTFLATRPREAHHVAAIVLSCCVGGSPNEGKIGYRAPVGSTVRANFHSSVLTSVMVAPGVGGDLANRSRRSARCRLNLRDARTGERAGLCDRRPIGWSTEGAPRRHT